MHEDISATKGTPSVLRNIGKLHAVNGVVKANMHVIGVLTKTKLFRLRNCGKVFILATRRRIYVAVF